MSTHRITGLFDVKMLPQAEAFLPEPTASALFARLRLDKQYHGDLAATGLGQMMSAGTATKGSAGYVAIELVSGSLQGLKGSFAVMHTGVMNRGTPQLSITVVPDSGTGELTGIAGTMGIRIEGGKHFYDFDYTLP